jgi:hypothetical protein
LLNFSAHDVQPYFDLHWRLGNDTEGELGNGCLIEL